MAKTDRTSRTRSTRDDRLATPKSGSSRTIRIDSDRFGEWSEAIARFFGTTQYLVMQTAVVIVWILLNIFAVSMRWDPYPFILLNLAFSTQAAYAAPLILLAQNRQEARDRASLEEDRSRAVAAKADTEFIARELASLRLAIGELATRDFVRSELEKMLAESQDDDEGKDGAKRGKSGKK
ncbi:DUF1003 domain-containing protein [Epidermidibacterium keratini]|uniref:DUF1003 domain-containing protein n=1 Tax=Epidermidibacterium keratini TaxID=1891644 RepID=A0A7L4YK42_9ACTN|nr:DUF1003 domain-containing protein [Epidermidibacterium keratini]QHB99624.1 DUF1003 domain-containing protein [Epidermidibacterium keratini]